MSFKKITKNQSTVNPIHYRRCHICNSINECENKLVEKCICGKSFAPFVFFDEKKALLGSIVVGSESEPTKLSCSQKITRLATQTNYPPLQGLTVYW